MLHDALAHFEGQVQSGEARVAVFEGLDDAQGVKIVIEALAEAAHLAVQFVFAGMREGRMADVVAERQGLGQVFIERERQSHGAGDLRDLDGVGEASCGNDRKCRPGRPGFCFPGGGRRGE